MIECCEENSKFFISSDQGYAQIHKIKIEFKKICLCREKMTDKKKIREKAEMFENYYNRNKYG